MTDAKMLTLTWLLNAGFSENRGGELQARGCSVTLYPIYTIDERWEWELDIKLPNGTVIGCDTTALTGHTAAEMATALRVFKEKEKDDRARGSSQ